MTGKSKPSGGLWQAIELRELRVFLAVATELHFGRAGERIGVSRPRVSQTVRHLETKVGGRLFARTSRRVSLTPLGADLADSVPPILEQLEQRLAEFTGTLGTEGVLVVGMTALFSGGPLFSAQIASFQNDNPRCSVKMVELPPNDQYGGLLRHEIDLVVGPLPITDPQLRGGPELWAEGWVLVVASSHPLAGRKHVSVAALSGYLTLETPGLPVELAQVSAPQATGSTPSDQRGAELMTIGEALATVSQGTAVLPVSASVDRYYGHPGIEFVPITDAPPGRSGLIRRVSDVTSPAAALIRHLERTTSATKPTATVTGSAGKRPG